MKKMFLTSAVLAIAGVGLVAGSAMALGFSSTGYVDPNYNDSWDSTSLTGTALFEFYIDETWPQVNRVTIELDDDIFTGITASDFTVLNPSGWTTSVYTGTSGNVFDVSLAGVLATSTNDPIQITFDYTLLDEDMYDNASEGVPGGWDWDEGQAWGLAYTLDYGFYTPHPLTGSPVFVALDTSGGSTAPVPEPATMLLFGTGLAGLAGVVRKKRKNS
ncbi:hypothetical protein GF1_07190 [Desulfolithobacter dissulfuricans]|uniref:Ice-binding protein C-terminal domain-containing protein n=1 Tax=Desulfolithobacter dissulfuricans TaxID=2795293 RepID=A0A915TYX4_9BACT|nr:PEP-CTERM sorting domain-containing protein [Desulfolithobacter dissulfuricans]BCO08343.1 hypothetical protein GF1_07190 [Desulfolithobacter dissulfuricans]